MQTINTNELSIKSHNVAIQIENDETLPTKLIRFNNNEDDLKTLFSNIINSIIDIHGPIGWLPNLISSNQKDLNSIIVEMNDNNKNETIEVKEIVRPVTADNLLSSLNGEQKNLLEARVEEVSILFR